ncbi:MAG TPA: cobalamin-dependent protein [Candidatus Wunengus sp. YC61]|uniref:cobalamin-dependent protein n=1 Tax=Candidatus Wunengus sp. YC61 TaxID=3367698 RepID=UPI0040251F90
MSDTVPQFSAKTWRAPNLAISSIAGNIQPHHDVALAGLVLKRKNLLSSIKKMVEEYRPDVIGLSAMTFQFNTAWRIAEFIKSIHQDIKIAIGGYHATLMYEEIASNNDGKPLENLDTLQLPRRDARMWDGYLFSGKKTGYG